MFLEKLGRALQALIYAVSAGAILVAACALCKLLDRHAAYLVGSKERLPSLTILFESLIPDPGRMLDSGLLAFVIGCGCLAWAQRPTALQTVFHAVTGVLALSIFTTSIAFMFVGIDLDKVPPPAWWKLPWIVFCLTPLAMAAFSWRKKAQKAGAKDPV